MTEASKKDGSSSTKEEAKKKKVPPKLSEYNFAVDSAQFATSRCLTDGIILPQNTRTVLSRCLSIAMKHYVPTKDIISIRQAAGLPPVPGSGYGAMRI